MGTQDQSAHPRDQLHHTPPVSHGGEAPTPGAQAPPATRGTSGSCPQEDSLLLAQGQRGPGLQTAAEWRAGPRGAHSVGLRGGKCAVKWGSTKAAPPVVLRQLLAHLGLGHVLPLPLPLLRL